jgi:hypothetical protein
MESHRRAGHEVTKKHRENVKGLQTSPLELINTRPSRSTDNEPCRGTLAGLDEILAAAPWPVDQNPGPSQQRNIVWPPQPPLEHQNNMDVDMHFAPSFEEQMYGQIQRALDRNERIAGGEDITSDDDDEPPLEFDTESESEGPESRSVISRSASVKPPAQRSQMLNELIVLLRFPKTSTPASRYYVTWFLWDDEMLCGCGMVVIKGYTYIHSFQSSRPVLFIRQ